MERGRETARETSKTAKSMAIRPAREAKAKTPGAAIGITAQLSIGEAFLGLLADIGTTGVQALLCHPAFRKTSLAASLFHQVSRKS